MPKRAAPKQKPTTKPKAEKKTGLSKKVVAAAAKVQAERLWQAQQKVGLETSLAIVMADVERLRRVATKATREEQTELTNLVQFVASDLQRVRVGLLEIRELVARIEAIELKPNRKD